MTKQGRSNKTGQCRAMSETENYLREAPAKGGLASVETSRRD